MMFPTKTYMLKPYAPMQWIHLEKEKIKDKKRETQTEVGLITLSLGEDLAL